MIRYTVRRLLLAIPTLIGAATLVFFLGKMVPGDPARILAGPNADAADIANLRAQLGLNRPLLMQYGSYILNLGKGNLGTSIRTGLTVTQEIASAFPYTLSLTICAMIFALIFGCGLGLLAALRRNTVVDVAVSTLSVAGVSMPPYWIGLLLILVFSLTLKWLPVAGASGLTSYVLPAVTLGLFPMGYIARQTRSAMVQTLQLDFIRSIKAKGVSTHTVILKHAFRNALLPIVTVTSLQLGALLGGAIIVENIFAWPGLGTLMVNSINVRDFPTIQGTVFVLAGVLILINLLTDLLYAYIDPRIRYA